MVEHILRKNDRGWHYYFLPSSNEFSFWAMFQNAKDRANIKSDSDEMINTNMIEAQRTIDMIIKDKFNGTSSCPTGPTEMPVAPVYS